MAKASKSEVSSDEAYSSEEEAQVNDQVNVEEDDDEMRSSMPLLARRTPTRKHPPLTTRLSL
nr:unnamed protein product [Brassica rapa]